MQDGPCGPSLPKRARHFAVSGKVCCLRSRSTSARPIYDARCKEVEGKPCLVTSKHPETSSFHLACLCRGHASALSPRQASTPPPRVVAHKEMHFRGL